MAALSSHSSQKSFRGRTLPVLLTLAVFVIVALLLRQQGRLWICKCGRVDIWVGNVWSSDNSQHLADPYSFTHIQHGLIFAGICALLLRRVSWPAWRMWAAVVVEAAWEVFENSAFVINRYRAATVSLDYTGDTVVNSCSDIAMCIAGFWLARYLGVRRTAVLFVVIELAMVLTIRDSLLLNILMLIHPVDAIKAWQLGH